MSFERNGNIIETFGWDITHPFAGVGDAVTDLMNDRSKGIGKYVKDFIEDEINSVGAAAIHTLTDPITSALGSVTNVETYVKDKIVALLTDTTQGIGKTIHDAMHTLTDPITGALGSITNVEEFVKNKILALVNDTSQGVGRVIHDAMHTLTDPINTALKDIKDIPAFVKDKITDGIKDVVGEVLTIEKKVKGALDSLKAAGLKFGKELHKVINKIKDAEHKMMRFVKKAIKQLKNFAKKIKDVCSDWWKLVLEWLLKILNKYLAHLNKLYFLYTFSRSWICLTILFILYGCLSIWSVFGNLNTIVRYVVFYGIMYYWYTLGFFTLKLHIDPATFVKQFIDFFHHFYDNLKHWWKESTDAIDWMYFVIVSYIYAGLFSLVILLVSYIVPIVFNVLGTDNAIYVRNIVFYLLMYYFYTKGYFSIDVNKDSIQFVEDLVYSLTHPKKFFESLGDYVWEWFDMTMSIDLFIGYWILLTCVFMIYDNLNLFDVFDEFGDGGAWFAQNGVFYGIMFLMYLSGFFNLTSSAKELYDFFSTLSWREISNLSVNFFLWLFFIVVSFVYAVILSAIIVVFSLATDVFNIFGSDNAVITRNVFFYLALCVIYSFGLMTFKIPDGQDIWSVINFLLF